MAFKMWLENRQERDQAYRELWTNTLKTLVGGENASEAMSKSLSKLSTGDKTDPHSTYKGSKAVAKMISPILDRMREMGQKLGPDESGVDLSANADATLQWLGTSGNNEGKSIKPMTVGDLLKHMFGDQLVGKFTGNAVAPPTKGEPDTAKAQVPPQPPSDVSQPPVPPDQPPPEMQQPVDPGIPQQGPSLPRGGLVPPALHNASYKRQGNVFAEWMQNRN